MRSLVAFVCMFFLGIPQGISRSPSEQPKYQTQQIEGWTLHVREELLEDETAETERAIELLKEQLQEIKRVVPLNAVAELQKVSLWFSPEYQGVQQRAEYHPGAGWLRDNHRDPDMEKGIEFTNVRIFERETKRMLNFALHELSHAYHDRVLADGFCNKEIVAAFEAVKAKGIYERVEQRFGDGRSVEGRAYALSNSMEYFAESSEAYFSTNDFYPFSREQLAKHDPQMVTLLQRLWGEKTVAANSSGDSNYKDWKYSGSIWLLTTPDGANLAGESNVENFPVLIRLNSDFFDFSQAKPNGEDLRIVSDRGESLAFEIEAWDADEGTASVWVRVPQIAGNARQELKLYWGNADALSESDGSRVFNLANGYMAVLHMDESLRDQTGSIACTDVGTEHSPGIIGSARHFNQGAGVSGGETIESLPTGSAPHSTEVWFRAEKPNSRVVGWGNEHAQGKVVMHYASPPHVKMDCYFSDANVDGTQRIPLQAWTQVVHTYAKGDTCLYVNGMLDESKSNRSSPLAIKSPARLYLGGWYNHYDFAGDIDEVRISNTVRSAEWIKLQYENQKPNQMLSGPIVSSGTEWSVSQSQLSLAEGTTATISAQAGGAQKVFWILKQGEQESIVATDRFAFTFEAGRVVGNQNATLTWEAIYANETKSIDIPITIAEAIPEPEFTIQSPQSWDGRTPIEIMAQVSNLAELQAKGVERLNIEWRVDDVAVIRRIDAGKLLLTRSQGSGPMRITATIDNGGSKITKQLTVDVQTPQGSRDAWIPSPRSKAERPEDNQFIASENAEAKGLRKGTLVYAGECTDDVDSVFLRVFADDKPYANLTVKPESDRSYKLAVQLQPQLVKYRTEFGTVSGKRESILHTAKNIVCGDAYLIIGQSNAVASDFGKDNPLKPNEWIRTFGASTGDPNGSRLRLWANAEARSDGEKAQIGYWGMELGRRLVESEKIPICLINGAVGGTRIDQHQRNELDPTDANTIYGRLLWRVQQANLTHGIRAILWHQGENDQGADGPTGGYGYETYRQYFVDLAASWKEDYPNVEHYYMFQIWPKSCAMGIMGSDNRLREVQRTLPRLFSNLSVLSTLGIKPPGGCHYPADGYAEFARLLHPMMQYHLYHRMVNAPFDAPNLRRAYFTSFQRDEIVLEFDQFVVWSESLASQFYLDGQANLVASGSANAGQIMLKLKEPASSKTISYLDSAHWSPDNLLYGKNKIAALTFCDVPIESSETQTKDESPTTAKENK